MLIRSLRRFRNEQRAFFEKPSASAFWPGGSSHRRPCSRALRYGSPRGAKSSSTVNGGRSPFVTSGSSTSSIPRRSQGCAREKAPIPIVRRIGAAPADALKALARREFFTSVRLGDRRLAFKPPQDVQIETDARNILRLRFTLPFEAPVVLSKSLLLDVRDPDLGVAFGLEIANPVTMTGNHAGCSAEIVEPETFVASYGKQPPTSATIMCR